MFSLKLPSEVYDAVHELAWADRRSMAFVVREAIEEYVAARRNTHNSGNDTDD